MHVWRRWLKPGQGYSAPAETDESSKEDVAHGHQQQHVRGSIPIAAYLLLPAAVFAISSSGTVFQLMGEVPPITLAAWRLQLTTVVLAVGALWQWRTMSAELRQRSRSSGGLLLLSGVCLAAHFGCWVWSLKHTSLTHSLLFVSCSPLLLAGWALLTRQPISKAEVYGSLLGLLGAVWLAFSAAAPAELQAQPPVAGLLASPPTSPPGSLRHASTLRSLFDAGLQQAATIHHALSLGATSHPSLPFSTTVRSLFEYQDGAGQHTIRRPGISGDIASLIAAFAFVGYLGVGGKLRKFMPVFVYAFPVTGIAALILTATAAMTESSAAADIGLWGGVMAWLFNGRYAAFVCYLAFVPGIVGHTGFNALLKYMTALTVALAFQLEPVGGSLIGWAAGVADAPGWHTGLAGSLLLAATIIVTYASAKRQEQEAKAAVVEGDVGIELGREAHGGVTETSALIPLSNRADSAA